MREEQLSALLDGALPPAEAAEVAALIAREPEFARRFAALARLKAITAEMDAGLAAPPLPERRSWRQTRPQTKLVLGTASLAAVIALFALLPPSEPPAVAAHRRFMALPSEPLLTEVVGIMDLAATGLQLERTEPVGGGLYAGYRGPRGCRLGIWTGPVEGLPRTAPVGWRVESFIRDGQAVWIVADPSMDADRFAALAAALREDRPRTMMALGPQAAAPCIT